MKRRSKMLKRILVVSALIWNYHDCMMLVMLFRGSKLHHGQIMEYWLTKQLLNQEGINYIKRKVENI